MSNQQQLGLEGFTGVVALVKTLERSSGWTTTYSVGYYCIIYGVNGEKRGVSNSRSSKHYAELDCQTWSALLGWPIVEIDEASKHPEYNRRLHG